MQLLIYILTYPFLWVVSILPFKILYLFSDFVFFLVYTVFGYRKKVVSGNLKLVFPKKDENEIKRIQRRCYGHMCDLFLETIKVLTVTEKELKTRYKVTNMEVLQNIEREKSVLVVFSHYANWEWSVIINRSLRSKGYAVYQKIGNKYFDALVRRIRGQWNNTPITQQEMVKTVIRNHQNAINGVYGVVSDQSPQVSRAQYWSEFMGIKVPIHNGADILARKLDLAVVFLKTTKVKRGHYAVEFIPITTSGKETGKNEIIDQFLKETEKQIREEPAYYLWTHRRWKHRDKVPENFR